MPQLGRQLACGLSCGLACELGFEPGAELAGTGEHAQNVRTHWITRLSWRGLDGLFLALVVMMLVAGVILSLAASPSAAARLGLASPHYFFVRHLIAGALSLLVLAGVAALPVHVVRRVCFILLCCGVIGVWVAAFWGAQINGAQRWLQLGPVSFQPIEVVKPAFIALAALVLAAGTQRRGPPGIVLSAGMLVVIIAGLALQPDVGQMVLLTIGFAITAVIAGVPVTSLAALGLVGAASLVAIAINFPHAVDRITAFWSGERVFQVDQARAAIANGGLFGVGPGSGSVKYALPDGHGDYILAVAAEEFGTLAVVFVVGLFAVLVFRGLILGLILSRGAADGGRGGVVASVSGMLGLQAMVNIAVTLDMVPAKGMTLPFVSYGGSSLLASGFAAGIVLAFSRRPQDLESDGLPVDT